jgi:glutamate racemase
MGPEVQLISSAEETAKDVFGTLLRDGLLASDGVTPSHEFVCTGDPVLFRRIADVFLGPSIPDVRVAVPGGFQATAGVAPWS